MGNFLQFYHKFPYKRIMNDLYQIRVTKEMGRGVFAKRDIEVGTKLLQLQPRNYLRYGIVAEHEFFGRLQQFYQTNKKQHFAFYMAFAQQHKEHEKKHSLAVIKYIDNLPKIFNSLICWNEDELEMIEDKELIQKARQKRGKIEESFLKVKKYLVQNSQVFFFPNYQENYQRRDFVDYEQKSQEYINESEQTQPDEQEKIGFYEYRNLCANVTFQQFLHFYTAIVTRHVYNTNGYDSKSQLGALIPVLELFNHCPDGQVKDDTSFLKTIKHINKDQQIFVSYGELSNDQLLLEYGFVIDEEFYQVKDNYEAVLSAKICEDKWKGVVMELSKESVKQVSQPKAIGSKISQERTQLASRYNKIFRKQTSSFTGDN